MKIKIRITFVAFLFAVIMSSSAISYRYYSMLREGIPISSNFFITSIIIIFGVSLLTTSLFYIIAKRITGDIEGITEKVNEINKGNINVSLSASKLEEISSLRESLNRVLASLKLAVLKVGISKGELGLGEAIKGKKKAEKRFKDIVWASGDFIWECDVNGKYTYVSKNVKNLLGYSREAMIGKSIFELMPKEDVEEQKKYFYRDLKKKQPIKDLENTIITSIGKRIIVLTNAVPIISKKGKVLGYRGIDKDITEKKKIDEALFETQNKFKIIAENITDVLYVLDLKTGKYTYISPSAEQVFGYSEKEFSKLTPSKVLTKESYKYQLSEMKKKIKEGGSSLKKDNTLDLEGIRKDGKKIWLSVNARFLLDKENRPYSILGVARDVTENKKMNERFVELVNNLDKGVVIFEPFSNGKDFVFVEFNKKAEEIDKIKKKDLLGKKVTEVFPGVKTNGYLSNLIKLNKTGKKFESEFVYFDKKRAPFWRRNINYKLPSGELVVVYEDITQEKLDEENLSLFKKGFESSPNSMVLAKYEDKKAKIMYVNKSFTRYYGYSLNEAKNETPKVLKSGETPKAVYREMWKDVLNPKKGYWTGEIINKKKNGDFISVLLSINTIFDDKNKPIYFVANHVDITDKNKIETDLDATQQRFKKIVEVNKLPVYVLDLNGKIKYLSSAATDVLGYEGEDLIGGSFAKVLPFSQLLKGRSLFKKTLSGKSSTFEIILKSKNKRIKAKIMTTPIYKDNKVIEIQGTVLKHEVIK